MMPPDKRIIGALRNRRTPPPPREAMLSDEDMRLLADFLSLSQSIPSGQVGSPGRRRSENRDDTARERIRHGANYVRGDSPRGRRLLELSGMLKRGELSDGEFSRLRNEALRLSPT
jgi:hypothetical protein